jgi:OmpA-OmpF porin, OOP family
MNFRYACVLGLTLGLLGWGSAAEAQDTDSAPDGWYLRLEGGWNHLQDFEGNGSGTNLHFNSTHNEGYILGGAGGYKFGQLHLELELNYRNNSVDHIKFGATGALPAGGANTSQNGAGRITSFSEMVVGIYDLAWRPMPRLTPYIGLGIGYASLSMGGYGGANTNLSGDNDGVVALEPKLGLRYMISDSGALGLEYRFFEGLHPAFLDASGNKFTTSDYRSHSLLLSYTWFLGAPAKPAPTPAASSAVMPAPSAAPAPAERQVFIVFFDFDKSTITPAGKQIVAEAAKAYEGGHRVLLTGYTDRAGTQQYNLGLSRRRAEAVRAEMIRDGVPANSINASWKGEDDPRVPTPDGVREPQNRRVEIVLP